MHLEARDFTAIRDLVYRAAGLAFDERKLGFVQSRVVRRAELLGCASVAEYVRRLRWEDPDGAELQHLIEALTTNETYFFREYPQLECFANAALPELCERRRRAGQNRLAIWSAACSTGEEVYTLAIILRACLDDFSDWRIEVLGTDIDSQALANANRAAYSDRSVKDVPDEYLDAYFTPRAGRYCVAESIQSMTRFESLNLMDRRGMRQRRNYDAIFCRNALIYFDDASRRKVLGSFYDALAPGGYLFLGHSESVGRISAAFEMVSREGYIAYRRPLDGAAHQEPVCPIS